MLRWRKRVDHIGQTHWSAQTAIGLARLHRIKSKGTWLASAPWRDFTEHRSMEQARDAVAADYRAALLELADTLDALRAERGAR